MANMILGRRILRTALQSRRLRSSVPLEPTHASVPLESTQENVPLEPTQASVPLDSTQENAPLESTQASVPLPLEPSQASSSSESTQGNALLKSTQAAPAGYEEDVYIERVMDRYSPRIFGSFPLLMDLKDKVAIITGGETGIGLAAAHALVGGGAQVVVLAGVSKGEEAVKQITETHGEGRACFMHMDVNDPREFEELFYRVDTLFHGIDIVFNNAGILQDQLWEYEVDTNLKSALRGTILGLEYMGRGGRGGRRGGGVIVNHADVAAIDGFAFAPCYAATKAGVMVATRSFGAEFHYERTGVRVVGLLTGATDTALLRQIGEKQMDAEWGRAAEEQLTSRPPQSPEVVGRALAHLVRYAAPASLWTVDGGKLFLTTIPARSTLNTQIYQF